jgi:hypothetical protein
MLAETHLSLNVDWGLMKGLEDACQEIEKSRNPDGEGWKQYENPDTTNLIVGWQMSPKVVDCKVLKV